jgi:hypothetical protein
MTTIGDVREIFAKRGLYFEQLPPDDCLVRNVEVVERHVGPQGDSKIVLNIRYVTKEREFSDLFLCEGKIINRKKKIPSPSLEVPKPRKLEPLPLRPGFEFDSKEEAIAYLRDAISHLLRDKDYKESKHAECDVYFEKSSLAFFFNLTPCFDELALDKANRLIDLRMKYGAEHNYGLAALAFQESLGVPLLQQEHWLRQHGEFLAAHRIGVYTVNNKNPNQIFPFTVYPRKDHELARYFIYTVQQWPVMRDKYIQYRAGKERAAS